MKNKTELFSQIETWTRTGELTRARVALEKCLEAKLDRSQLADAARLAWRLSVPFLGLKALGPVVHPGHREVARPTEDEKVEYAACLIKAGANEEATELLSSVDPEKNPKIFLYRGFQLVGRWDYSSALPRFKDYLERTNDPYQLLVAKSNIAAALVFERRHLEASNLLRELLYDTSLRKHRFLLAIVMELSAGNFILQKQWVAAKDLLKRSREMFETNDSLFAFFVDKWTAIVKLHSGGTSLDEIRKRAWELRHWETLRECDRFEAILKKDRAKFLRVYFGTPFRSYREKLERDWGSGDETLPEKYVWNFLETNGPKLDLSSPKRAFLKTGQLNHRILIALTADFYRPTRIAELHEAIFPGEYFNPVSSLRRIEEAVRRLRLLLSSIKIPLSINREESAYRLVASDPCQIIVTKDKASSESWELKLQSLREKIGDEFQVQEVATALGESTRNVRRLLLQATTSKLLEKVGKGAKTRYRFR